MVKKESKGSGTGNQLIFSFTQLIYAISRDHITSLHEDGTKQFRPSCVVLGSCIVFKCHPTCWMHWAQSDSDVL